MNIQHVRIKGITTKGGNYVVELEPVIDQMNTPPTPQSTPATEPVESSVTEEQLMDEAKDRCIRQLKGEVEKANARAENWEIEARRIDRDRDYYYGLLVKIGQHLGVESFTDDTGKIGDSVLCSKLPKMVFDLLRKRVNSDKRCLEVLMTARQVVQEIKSSVCSLEAYVQRQIKEINPQDPQVRKIEENIRNRQAHGRGERNS